MKALYFFLRWFAETIHTLDYKNEWMYAILNMDDTLEEFLILVGSQIVEMIL